MPSVPTTSQPTSSCARPIKCPGVNEKVAAADLFAPTMVPSAETSNIPTTLFRLRSSSRSARRWAILARRRRISICVMIVRPATNKPARIAPSKTSPTRSRMMRAAIASPTIVAMNAYKPALRPRHIVQVAPRNRDAIATQLGSSGATKRPRKPMSTPAIAPMTRSRMMCLGVAIRCIRRNGFSF